MGEAGGVAVGREAGSPGGEGVASEVACGRALAAGVTRAGGVRVEAVAAEFSAEVAEVEAAEVKAKAAEVEAAVTAEVEAAASFFRV